MNRPALVRACGVGLAAWSASFLLVACGILASYDNPGNWPHHLGLTDLRIVGGTTPGEYAITLAMALAQVALAAWFAVVCLASPGSALAAVRVVRVRLRTGLRLARRALAARVR
jgi:hypothetical protein